MAHTYQLTPPVSCFFKVLCGHLAFATLHLPVLAMRKFELLAVIPKGFNAGANITSTLTVFVRLAVIATLANVMPVRLTFSFCHRSLHAPLI